MLEFIRISGSCDRVVPFADRSKASDWHLALLVQLELIAEQSRVLAVYGANRAYLESIQAGWSPDANLNPLDIFDFRLDRLEGRHFAPSGNKVKIVLSIWEQYLTTAKSWNKSSPWIFSTKGSSGQAARSAAGIRSIFSLSVRTSMSASSVARATSCNPFAIAPMSTHSTPASWPAS